MAKRVKNQIFFVFLMSTVILSPGKIRAEQPADMSISDSISIGTPMKGTLDEGNVFPKKGAGFVLTDTTRERRARFAIAELIDFIKKAAFRVTRRHPGSILRVADLSKRTGGPIPHHGSHQNGRDVDLLFYLNGPGGETLQEFIPVDTNGYSTDPPMKYKLDLPRNWALLEGMLSSDKAQVQWIFVADHIKKLLLEYAEQIGAPKRLIDMARQVVRQPGEKTHMDHFHVRIYCPGNDKPQCQDVGPRWAWTR